MINARTLLRTVEIDFGSSADDNLSFRVEVFSSQEHATAPAYSAKVFRYDMFRLEFLEASAIAALRDRFADHVVLVLDPMFGEQTIQASSVDDAVAEIIEKIKKQLYL